MASEITRDNLIVDKEVRQMEKTLAVLMALGIFVVIPVLIGLATVGVFLLKERWGEITENVKTPVLHQTITKHV